MVERFGHAKAWIEKAKNDLLNADNNLSEDVLEYDSSAESLRESLAILNPYSVEVRYPGDAWLPTPEDAKEAREATQEIYNWVKSKLGISF